MPGYFEYCKNRLEEIERKLSIEAKNIIFDYCNVILENGSFITNTIDDNNLLQIYIGNLLIEIFLTWKKNPYKYCGEIIRMNKLTKEWYNFEIDDLNDNGKNFIHYYEKFLKSYMELQDNVIAYLEKLYFENRKLESYEYELANYIEKNVKRDMERDMEKSIDNLNGMKNVGRRNRRKREPSGIAKPTNLSREMCQFLGINEDIRLSRIDVTKRIIDYIRKYDLCNPNNKKEIIPDEKLQALLKVPKKETLTYFNLQKYLRNHCLG